MKKTVPTAALWALSVLAAGLYLILNVLDSCVFWHNLFSGAGFLDTRLHAALTLGCGVYTKELYSPLMHFIMEHELTGSLLHRFTLTIIPGLLMLLPAAGALLCRAAGWRIPAGVLAGINLVLHLLLLLIVAFSSPVIHILLWCALAAASVLLLLSCIGVMDGKLVPITFGALTLISLAATVTLIFFHVYISGEMAFISTPRLPQALLANVNDWPWYASQFWPLSRAAWFLFLGLGTALPIRRASVYTGAPAQGRQMNAVRPAVHQPAGSQPQPVAAAVQSKPIAADALTALERLAALHQQGVLTDEEYLRKKTELLERI